jgi:hypothetical protein
VSSPWAMVMCQLARTHGVWDRAARAIQFRFRFNQMRRVSAAQGIAAVFIQKHWRRMLVWQRLQAQHAAAAKIQAYVRSIAMALQAKAVLRSLRKERAARDRKAREAMLAATTHVVGALTNAVMGGRKRREEEEMTQRRQQEEEKGRRRQGCMLLEVSAYLDDNVPFGDRETARKERMMMRSLLDESPLVYAGPPSMVFSLDDPKQFQTQCEMVCERCCVRPNVPC